jgi:hypothetical protein
LCRSRVGKRLWLKATDTTVSIFEDYRLVATHVRARAVGTRRTVREHLPPQAQAFFAHDRLWCTQQALQVGPACAELIDKLLTDRILERLRAAQGVLRLLKPYGPQRLEAACARALAHDSVHYRTVKTILAGGFDRLQTSPAVLTSSPYMPGGRFVRRARELFEAEASTADLFPPSTTQQVSS